MNQIKSFFTNLKDLIIPKKYHPYAQPTQTRTILGYIARAVQCLSRGGFAIDAHAFRSYCADVFDTDKVEEAFSIAYEIDEDRTAEEFYEDAQGYLKKAGQMLADQRNRFGESNWEDFMVVVRGMKGREHVRREEVRKLDGVRKGDDAGVVERAREMGRTIFLSS